ncbi:unnamed protein product, partial [Closterium sp. NIES-54]
RTSTSCYRALPRRATCCGSSWGGCRPTASWQASWGSPPPSCARPCATCVRPAPWTAPSPLKAKTHSG